MFLLLLLPLLSLAFARRGASGSSPSSPGPTNRSLSSLEPDVQEKVSAVIADLTSAGFSPFVAEAHRTQARQDALYQIGRRGVPGEEPVTWTTESKHTAGRAVDIIDGRNNPATGKIYGWGRPAPEAAPGDFFLALASAAESHGMKSLGPSIGDWAHIEA